MNPIIELENKYCAHNYLPLPVVLVKGKGVYLWDRKGKKYIDMMSAYSAVSFGHCNPKLIATLHKQAQQLDVISRAFYGDKLGIFVEKLCKLTKQDKALPMNSGAEAVETAIKAARKWAYTVKKVPQDQAEIIVCENNFHGRTTTIVSMSTEPQYKFGFGPLTPGFKFIPFDDAEALAKAITPNTAAFLVEPIQGEGGVKVPAAGYLKKCEEICRKNNVLLICDEIQTGLGRTGKLLASVHEKVKPDGLILGKALGGGMLPVSVFLAKNEVMNVFTPGDHGSTFGGNALAAAVGLAALNILTQEKLVQRAATMGRYMMRELRKIKNPLIKEIRGKGLMIGVEIDAKVSAREICLALMQQGVLTKDTHATVLRLMPPLIINKKQIDFVVKKLAAVLQQCFSAFRAK